VGKALHGHLHHGLLQVVLLLEMVMVLLLLLLVVVMMVAHCLRVVQLQTDKRKDVQDHAAQQLVSISGNPNQAALKCGDIRKKSQDLSHCLCIVMCTNCEGCRHHHDVAPSRHNVRG
jgi:sensor histidine kinase regulating citrate/malate metabolism